MPHAGSCHVTCLQLAFAASCLLGACSSTHAQWQAIKLHAPIMRKSEAYAASGPIIGGQSWIEKGRPTLWNTQTQQLTYLNPPPFIGGRVRAIQGNVQAGGVATETYGHAAMWSGSAETFVDMHPLSNPRSSEIVAMDGGVQVGDTRALVTQSYHHAAMWRGTPQSHIDLNPPGMVESYGTAAADGMQGGYFRQTELHGYHAALWRGSAESMIDLHPAGARESRLMGMASGQQVGSVSVIGEHAAMWSGSAASWIDMNPPGAGVSMLNATCGSAQVGWANTGNPSAGIWFGTPDSFVSLHQFLPPGEYYQSIATGVSHVNGVYYVSGYALSNLIGHSDEAFVWIGVPAPGPGALAALAALRAGRRRRG
ncbi:MAG: hypothetical protein JNM07_13605 [Phycisphaerae bacterium]|nr:hypothetical protein [Phycisphaerae bacterium]